ncbi:TPA: hypothetical protein JI034_10390 [Acinetobacter baumannii]|uniref:hypothetical protein n=1 Tax=Acinetobacter baumannii TaxID=470 RepID=UPI0007E9FB21|nr:hypothetical protein [Acinetobacter baumannii]SBS21249.1 Uncharacterised protein [Acinetobacter baumannii]HAV2932528.1 hypothetical protein [Acinetobacter baumannii]HAV3087518.1 hypothetical protein [Acinetobacter baumannii]HAV4615546.1 hypothetical protein [Acinetobacter baumannii]HAV4622434.1 hypothetical protein [Acinetobacter baumannii]
MMTLNKTTGIQKLKEILQEFDSCMYIERDIFFDKHYDLVKSESDIEQIRIAVKAAELKKGARVKVDFTHVPDKGQNNIRFVGNGTVDLFDDNRVFGRLDDGQPFCCLVSDIEILDSEKLESAVNHEESKAINKVFFFICLVLGCAVVKGCGL